MLVLTDLLPFYSFLNFESNKLFNLTIIFIIFFILYKIYFFAVLILKSKSVRSGQISNLNTLKPNLTYNYKIYRTINNKLKNKRFYSTSKPKTKTLKERFITGLKVGWNAPMLPEKVANLHNHPFIRIFRVLGGISIVTVLSKKHLLLFLPFKFIILILALAHFIYITYISIIKLWYGFKVLKSDKLNVKNSPFDHFASVTGKLLYCWKFGCQAGSAGLGLVGTSFMIDSMLEAGNHEKVFTPLIGKGVKFIVGGKPADNIFSDVNKNLKQIEDSKRRLEEIRNLLNKTNDITDSSDFSKKDIDSIKSVMDEIKDMEKSKLQSYTNDLVKKIKEYSDNSKK